MARIKIELPEEFLFSTEIKVRITDLNYGGHLGNDKMLTLLHEARVDFIHHLGFEGELNIGGLGIIVTDAVIVYKSEVFHNDLLKIEVGIGDFNKYGCDLFYRVTNVDSGKEVARAKTGIAFFNYETRKIAEVPEEFIERTKQ